MDITPVFWDIVSKIDPIIQNKESKRTVSPFTTSAQEIKLQVLEIEKQITKFTKKYFKKRFLFSVSENDPELQSFQEQIQSCDQNIIQLKNLLQDAENNSKSKLMYSNHQRAHYHCIIMNLFELIQQISKTLQYIKTMIHQDNHSMEWMTEESELDITPQQKQDIEVLIQRVQRQEEEQKRTNFEASLSPSQLQQLESENRLLILENDTMMNDAKDTEQSAVEINRLLSIFESKVAEQAEQIEKLYENAFTGEEFLQGAKEELQKTVSSSSTSRLRFLMAYIYLFLSLWLLFMHYIN